MVDVIRDPYGCLLGELASLIASHIGRLLGTNVAKENVAKFFEEPPLRKFGDLAIPLPRISRQLNVEFKVLRNELPRALSKSPWIEKVSVVGPYLNMFVDMRTYSELVFNSLRALGDYYGAVRLGSRRRIVVEYVSANPIHPLHIGSGRNAVLGEFISRILEFTGNRVERRYYVDDVGLQVAYLAYGYLLLGRPDPPEGFRPDVYYGLIYAATSMIVELVELRRRLEALREAGGGEGYAEILRRVDELMADLSRVREVIPREVDLLIERVGSDPSPKHSVAQLVRDYEFGKREASVVREVAEKVVEGIKETLRRLDISMDRWDWESDLIREGLVAEILERARRSPYYTTYKGVPALDFRSLLKDEGIRRRLRIPEGLEIPPLILMRADGTTLYTTRDIAYTLKKFQEWRADKVYNVIATEQTLPQAQLRLALYALGYVREAENTIHYSYEMVNLVGTSMSGRRGRYVTVDEVIDRLKHGVLEIMRGRGGVREDVAEKMARSAFKFMMLSISPNKVLTFDPAKALDLKRASGPYIQYTYARARAVLRKGGGVPWDSIDFSGCREGIRKELTWLIGKFPNVIRGVSESLRPEDLSTFIIKVADLFNRWYDSEPIAKEADKGFRALKLAITYGVLKTLATGMKLLGLDILERV